MALDMKNPEHAHRSVGFIMLGLVMLIVAGLLAFDLTRNNTPVVDSPEVYEYTVNQAVNTRITYANNSFFVNGPTSDTTAFVSDLTDKIGATFTYNYKASKDQSVTYTYNIAALIKGTYSISGGEEDNSNVWSKRFQLVPATSDTITGKTFTVNPSVEIPFNEYRSLIEEFRTGLALPINTEADIIMTMDVKGRHEGADFTDHRVSTVSVPLNTQIYQPKVKYDKTDTKQVIPADTKAGQDRWVQIETIAALALGVLGLAALVFGFRKQIFKTPYQRELERIYRYHDGIIIRASRPADLEGKNVVPVRSFDDILNLEEEVKSPIVAAPLGSEATQFMITKDAIVYVYTLGNELIDHEADDLKQVEHALRDEHVARSRRK